VNTVQVSYFKQSADVGTFGLTTYRHYYHMTRASVISQKSSYEHCTSVILFLVKHIVKQSKAKAK
jgi:hypothetical protein